MKYIFIAFLFSVINIHILHYKLSQTLNSLTKKSQSGHSFRDGGSICFLFTFFYSQTKGCCMLRFIGRALRLPRALLAGDVSYTYYYGIKIICRFDQQHHRTGN
jgi:hypothetical protein